MRVVGGQHALARPGKADDYGTCCQSVSRKPATVRHVLACLLPSKQFASYALYAWTLARFAHACLHQLLNAFWLADTIALKLRSHTKLLPPSTYKAQPSVVRRYIRALLSTHGVQLMRRLEMHGSCKA